MNAGMTGVIAAHSIAGMSAGTHLACRCNKTWVPFPEYHSHLADELAKAGYGDVQEAKAGALTDAADWLVNGEAAGIIAYDGPSNRGEVVAAYDAALEDPEGWLRERAAVSLTIDPADLYREGWDAMADAWDEGFRDGARQDAEGDDGTKFVNPYRDEAAP